MNRSEDQLRVIINRIPALAWSCLPDGTPEFLNQRWLDYTGMSTEQALDSGWKGAIHPEDLGNLMGAWERLLSSGEPGEVEARMRRFDGEYHWFLFRAEPVQGEQGEVVRWYGTNTDIEDRKRAEGILHESEKSLRLLVDGIGGLVAIMSPEGEVEFINNQGLEYFGKTLEDLKGWTTSDAVHPDDLPRAVADWMHSVKTGEPYDVDNRLRGVDGVYRWFHSRGLSLRDTEGRIVRWYVLLTDIDERRRTEERLRRSEAYLSEAQKLSHTGSFGWSVPSGEIHWSEETYSIFQYDRAVKRTLELAFQRIHPDDKDMVQQTLDCASNRRADFEIEHRLLMPDGTVKYIHVLARMLETASGDLEYVGAVTDVTATKRAVETLRESEAYLAEAQRLSHTGSWAWNPSTTITTYMSEECCRVLGLDPQNEMLSLETALQRIHPDDRQTIAEKVARATRERAAFELDYRYCPSGGEFRDIHQVGHPVLSPSGDLVGFVGTLIDITERKRADEALRRAFEEIKGLRDQLYRENLALKEEVDRASMFEEIVGISPALHAVLSRVSKVAPTDSTVLITGETGTGKELIARAVHKRSQRASRAFVSVNCAATPRDLIASELFGHEKGAFTGATQRRLGRFELAEGGTIFLDEIGELPAETQIALLRVLQEHEFERVGGTGSIRANTRVIAATNRDLEAAVAAGGFRSDLFYRLNVFPIEVPPLRERKEDIPVLVEYFIDRYARNAGKIIRGISKKSLELLRAYPWPGNIRELQNIIERSAIVCDTENLSVDESWLSRRQALVAELKPELDLARQSRQLAAKQKEMIEAALRESGGRVSGPAGAASRLGIPGSTLESKIKSLRINKNRFKSADPSAHPS
jgi:PAS domain S-box-containing protein